ADWRLLLDALRRDTLLVQAPDQLPPVVGISTDSRHLERGAAFVAVRGSVGDGTRFVPDAIAHGAGVIVAEEPVAAPVPVIVVRDGRRAAIALARAWYGDP